MLSRESFGGRLERVSILLEIVRCGLEREDVMVEGYFRLLLKDMLEHTTLR